MPSFTVHALGIADPPLFPDREISQHIQGEHLDLVVINGGMESGQPSVMLIAHLPDGTDLVIETSLLAYQSSARTAVAMAETQFGWEMPP